MLEHAAPPGKLSWRPIYADVSAAGDLGYTTGPYELRKDPGDPVAASFGNYITIWQRQPDSTWKVLIDLGTANPPPAKPAPDFNPLQAKPALAKKQGMGVDAVSSMLASLDRRLSNLSATKGPAAALGLHVAKEARFMRAGRQPAVGAREVEASVAGRTGDLDLGSCQVRGLYFGGYGIYLWSFPASARKARGEPRTVRILPAHMEKTAERRVEDCAGHRCALATRS